MKKKLVIIGSIIAFIVIAAFVLLIFINQDTRLSNDYAEKDIKSRYLTIINDTEQVINEVHIAVGDGTEIEEMEQTNPDETSFSIKIPKQYAEYSTFTVTLIDRYGIKYQKEINNVPVKGRTEVKINKENYVKEKGDFRNKIDKFFNGD